MGKQYLLRNDGQTAGPFGLEELKKLRGTPLLTPKSLVSIDGTTWHPISRLVQRSGAARPDNPPSVTVRPDATSPAATEELSLAVGNLYGFIPKLLSRWKHPLLVGAGVAVAVVVVLLVANRGGNGKQPSPFTFSVADESKRTKEVWNEMRQIDLELLALAQADQIEFWGQNYLRYSRIDSEDAEPELVAMIEDRIKLAVDFHQLLVAVRQEIRQVQQRVDSMAQMGASLGSTDSHNPQGAAVVGEMYFRNIGAMAVQGKIDEIEQRYAGPHADLEKRMQEITDRRQNLSKRLEALYGTRFP